MWRVALALSLSARGAYGADILLLKSAYSCSDSDFARQVCNAQSSASRRYPSDNIVLRFLDAGCVTNTSGFQAAIMVGSYYETCAPRAAADNPDTWIVLLDSCHPDAAKYPNLLCGIFEAAQPSYTAGYLSGLISTSKVVGVVGGMPVPSVQQLFNGFIMGVRSSCPSCRVEGMYVNSFLHLRNAAAVATYLVNTTGADVVYGCGGGTGSQAIRRAAELGSYVVGVDVDEFWTTFRDAPQEQRARIVTSVLKHVDVALGILIDLLISRRVGGELPGLVGSIVRFDYTNFGVGLADCHLSCQSVGQSQWDTVRQQENALSARSIKTGLVGGAVPLLPTGAGPNTFYPVPNPSRPPAARFQAAMSSFNSGGALDFIALFGGRGAGGAALGDLWLYNVQSGKWLDSMHGMTVGTLPPPLAKACAVSLGDAVFIFGGRTADGQQSSALHSFKYQPPLLGFSDATSPLIRHEWTRHGSSGVAPLPVEGPGCAALNATCGVVFGGRAWLQPVNTLHAFCLHSGGSVHWTRFFDPDGAQGEVPSAREGAGVAIVPAAAVGNGTGDVLVVAGGISDGSESAEVWALSVGGGAEWARLPDLPHQLLTPLVFSAKLASGSDVLVVLSASGLPPDSRPGAFTYDPAAGAWNSQATSFSEAARHGTQHAAMVSSGGRVWAFGGKVGGQEQAGLVALNFQVQAGCAPALPGHFCVQGQLVPCTAGKYCPAGSTAPLLCPGGSVTSGQRKTNASACRPCPPGSYWSQLLAPDPGAVAKCMPCSPGTFAASAGSTSCRPCAPGTVTPETGQPACEQCPRGYFVLESAMTECNACGKGEFSASPGASECERCGQGKFASGRNSTTCTDCPVLGTDTRGVGARAVEECVCLAGTYLSASGSCSKCKEKMDCPLGSSEESLRSVAAGDGPTRDMMGVSIPYPRVESAFWTPRDDPLSVFWCRGPMQCPGGDPGSCSAHLEGQACAHCSDGYFWNGQECRSCSSVEASAFVFPTVPILLAFAVVYVLYFFSRDPLSRWGSWQNSVIAISFITLNHFQVLYLIHSANVPKPSPISNAWAFWAVTHDVLSVFRIDCAGFGGFAQKFLLSLASPVGLLAVTTSAHGLARLLSKAARMPELAMEFDRTWNVFFSLIFTFFTGVANMSLALFKCIKSPNGKATLASDPSINCHEGEWNSLMVVSLASVLVYCLGCGSMFSFAVAAAIRGETFSSTNFQKRWKFLFIKFRPDVHWWALVLLVRGVIENTGFLFLSKGLTQLYWIMFAEAIYLCLTIHWMPWRLRAANWCSITSSVCLGFACAFTSIFAEREARLDDAVAKMNVILSFGPLLLAIALAGYVFSATFFRREDTAGAVRLRRLIESLADMDEETHQDLFLRMGDWDRYHVQEFCELIESEFMGKKSSRRTTHCAEIREVRLRSRAGSADGPERGIARRSNTWPSAWPSGALEDEASVGALCASPSLPTIVGDTTEVPAAGASQDDDVYRI